MTVQISLQRGCPACEGFPCADPAECLYFLTSRPWADCVKCEGSGWAGEECGSLQVFCSFCNGSGLNEFTPGEITDDEISKGAKERHAAYVAKLSAMVNQSPARLAVAA
ncbi:hypothetical protein FKN01_02220 [Streptomyces sp. 130]|uniref:hypothetical protein n=1 Tax=Streptomyces sp. 130 TaxID=2591006 RepID=UPI00117BF98D|nr:hypothetical protein [Streptomyces sp. 130]TRV82104.1 hypothetical protein FKN01_02220 [Streptomyces sp. 130]